MGTLVEKNIIDTSKERVGSKLMKIITVIGARPQFVKAAVVSRALLNYNNIEEIVLPPIL
jgi:hypothetical protein